MRLNKLLLLIIIFALSITMVACGSSTPAPELDPIPDEELAPDVEPALDEELAPDTEPALELEPVSEADPAPVAKPDPTPAPKPDPAPAPAPAPTPAPAPEPDPEPDPVDSKITELLDFARPNLQERVDDGRITQEYMDEIMGQIRSGELSKLQLMTIMAKYL